MNSIASSSTFAFAAPLPAAPARDSATDLGAAGDALAAMRPAMNAASAVGRPTDAAGASAVLATGGSYLQGATATLGKLDEGIAKRRRELDRLTLSDPDQARAKQEQLDLLQRLRDRIQLSIERVTDILAGTDRDDIGAPEAAAATPPRRTRDEDLALLQQRREMLAPVALGQLAPAASTTVASTYANGTVAPT